LYSCHKFGERSLATTKKEEANKKCEHRTQKMIENKERKAQEKIAKKTTRHDQDQQKATSLKAFNEHWSSKNGKAIGGKLHERPLVKCNMST
jgi:hypothetical protein